MEYFDLVKEALLQTIYMVVVSTFFSVVIGLIPAVILTYTAPNGLKPNSKVYNILDLIINILRSFPFIILMVAVVPVTKVIVGKSIGTTAAIVPLTIAAAPFAARVIESSLREVNPGVIEAAKSFGASNYQILTKVMLKEAFPSIILGITLTVISVVSYSAMAGAIGGGGLGDVAVKYGYYRFKTEVTVYTVIILIILVQGIQSLGNLIYKKLTK